MREAWVFVRRKPHYIACLLVCRESLGSPISWTCSQHSFASGLGRRHHQALSIFKIETASTQMICEQVQSQGDCVREPQLRNARLTTSQTRAPSNGAGEALETPTSLTKSARIGVASAPEDVVYFDLTGLGRQP